MVLKSLLDSESKTTYNHCMDEEMTTEELEFSDIGRILPSGTGAAFWVGLVFYILVGVLAYFGYLLVR